MINKGKIARARCLQVAPPPVWGPGFSKNSHTSGGILNVTLVFIIRRTQQSIMACVQKFSSYTNPYELWKFHAKFGLVRLGVNGPLDRSSETGPLRQVL